MLAAAAVYTREQTFAACEKTYGHGTAFREGLSQVLRAAGASPADLDARQIAEL